MDWQIMQIRWLYKKNAGFSKRACKTIIILFLSITCFCQDRSLYSDKKKGELTITWGWNRAAYTKSNISFKGDDYDFKLYHVVAHDSPSLPVTFRGYFGFKNLTIPQTNFRASYFIKDNLAISLGDDHMKYVMDREQTVGIKGVITRNGNYKGTYNGNISVTENFLKFEHTDGLNYINIEVEKYFSFYHSRNSNCIISGMAGGGIGVLFPRTNVTFLDYEKNDRYHVSGFGLSSKVGLAGTFFKHFIIKLENKYGYINMPDIILHKKGIAGRAKQGFFFVEIYGMAGVSFSIINKKKHN